MTTIRPLIEADLPALRSFWEQHWGAAFVVAHGEKIYPDQLDGFVIEEGGEWLGLVTFRTTGAGLEIVSIDSIREGQGIGSRLIEAVVAVARQRGLARIWLITTNDNLPALGFYQKRGFRLVAVHSGAVDWSRKLKPSIPALGYAGIPIRDEIELELLCSSG